MAEPQADKHQTLAEQYALEKPDVVTKPVEVKVVETPDNVPSKEVVSEKAEEAPAAPEESPVVTPASEETSEVSPTVAETETKPASENSSEAAPEESSEAAPEESSDSTETSVDQEAVEETPEIKIETAPADFRFPTTNQTRHCFTRYVEYHRCIAAKGEEAPECDKFKKYYRSLCPGEWVDRWNEQRENGTFPGPL
ncbi:cytochrome c oxidase subunit 6b-1 [Rosa sericea]